MQARCANAELHDSIVGVVVGNRKRIQTSLSMRRKGKLGCVFRVCIYIYIMCIYHEGSYIHGIRAGQGRMWYF